MERNNNTTCPKCGNKADRILSGFRYYIYCSFCGANTIAKTISNLINPRKTQNYDCSK